MEENSENFGEGSGVASASGRKYDNKFYDRKKETLVNLHFERNVLWNPSNPDYKKPVKKEAAWQEIATLVGCSVVEAKSDFRQLHSQFNRELKKEKEKHSGDGTDDVYESSWWLMAKMRYLGDPPFVRRSITNLNNDSEAAANNEGIISESAASSNSETQVRFTSSLMGSSALISSFTSSNGFEQTNTSTSAAPLDETSSYQSGQPGSSENQPPTAIARRNTTTASNNDSSTKTKRKRASDTPLNEATVSGWIQQLIRADAKDNCDRFSEYISGRLRGKPRWRINALTQKFLRLIDADDEDEDRTRAAHIVNTHRPSQASTGHAFHVEDVEIDTVASYEEVDQ